MLHESDEQMFSGWQGNACVYSDVHLRTIERLAERASSMLEVGIRAKLLFLESLSPGKHAQRSK